MTEAGFPQDRIFPSDLYGYSAQLLLTGENISLRTYAEHPFLITNIPLLCELTDQLLQLQETQERFSETGFQILAFPSDSFTSSTNSLDEFKTFIASHPELTFAVFQPVKVKGKGKHPLFEWLTDRTANPDWGGKIGWDHAKFLISKKGKIRDRFSSNDPVNDDPILPAIEEALDSE